MKKFPKVLGLGGQLIAEIFNDPVDLTEKIDGSQCRINFTENYVQCGSKNIDNADENMFQFAHEQAARIWDEMIWHEFGDDVTLFTEFLNREKHNVLKYDRIPFNHLYLFGALIDGRHLQTEELIILAKELKIEPPHIISYKINVNNPEDITKYLETQSVLGGTVVEGVVIRNSHKSYPPLLVSTMAFDGYPMVGKLVRDDFKERLNKEWSNKKQRKIPLNIVTEEFLTTVRFHKSIQHLADEGKITYELKDLESLIPEFYNDLLDEEKDEIIKIAMENFWLQLKRKCNVFVVKEWKKYLLNKQFGDIND